MFRKGDIYTVHENPDREEPSERIELVREGFSVWAFVLTIVWLLAERLWIPFIAYLVLVIAIVELERRIGLSPISAGCIQLAMQFLLGCHAHDLQRWKLSRSGYRMTGVVVAESELLATQRVYHHPAAVL